MYTPPVYCGKVSRVAKKSQPLVCCQKVAKRRIVYRLVLFCQRVTVVLYCDRSKEGMVQAA